MLSKTKKWLGLIAGAFMVVVASASILNSTAEADSSTIPGSADDPVVTKSYVDQKIAEIAGNAGSGSTGSGTSGAIAALEVVTVPVGKTIYVKAGGELVIRTGKAVAVSSDANGLSDMTEGLDIAPGKPVANNHLILFPRDGRGVKSEDTSKNLIVLVRGGYEIK